MSALRPLPPRPSLEYEHKEAKALLRQLQAGHPDALARARAVHPDAATREPASRDATTRGATTRGATTRGATTRGATTRGATHFRLADAQLIIAREYGFTSWPRLVRYFGALDRQQLAYRPLQSTRPETYLGWVRSLLAEHAGRRAWAARVLGSYVPRFYAVPVNDVFAMTPTEDEARLAIARQHGAPSWEVLLERITYPRRTYEDGWDVDPMLRASKAMDTGDLDELRRVIGAHPELLHPTSDDLRAGRTLLSAALHKERERGAEAMRPVIDWLVAQGLDLQFELNVRLCGRHRIDTDTIRWLLARGADASWVSRSGVPVLEHALIRYWNGEAVDLVAARTTPRQALWIAAGLGDVQGVARYLDRHGRPTAAARRLRPDFDAVGERGIITHPDADDEEILAEAFFIAMTNGRLAVLEYLVARGFPVDSMVWDTPLLNIAVGNLLTPVAECLVRCGTDVNIRGGRPQQSARDLARAMLEQDPEHPDRRRIAELCGLDPAAIIAERDARPITTPEADPELRVALLLASDDAYRAGLAAIRPENLLFGMLRMGGAALYLFTRLSQMNLDAFRAEFQARVRAPEDRVPHQTLSVDRDAEAVLGAAMVEARRRRRGAVTAQHVLYALTEAADGTVAGILARHGGSAARLREMLEKGL